MPGARSWSYRYSERLGHRSRRAIGSPAPAGGHRRRTAAVPAARPHRLPALRGLGRFTRLVQVWSAPVGHLVRPYLVYRRRATTAAATPRPGRPRSAPGSRRAAAPGTG
ncbi:respiratory nitrate reductase subunit gamma [Streptomyces chartreusis]|uniref:respiratory nitrate reductase subunit gamma n=1 Tax=Streptomyces chartreusis TaxID=1969 RepID=UPI003F4CCAE2